MQSGIQKKTGITSLCTVALLLTTAVPSYSGAITDSFQSIAEQAWMRQYIPRSDEETLPLTDYDNFEVTELFRAETIEDLEAAVSDGYPMPWLEEVLKDTTIPWEDRYWLDCRVRASIAQNTHTFFNPAGNPVHIDADAVFPGEYYWQEHMIVDPAGANDSSNSDRPSLPTDYFSMDSGHILNLFGNRTGDIAIAVNGLSLSRDASIGTYVTGQAGEFPSNRDQCYACLLYPDGSFIEIPFDGIGQYSGTVSADGNTLAFFRQGAPNVGPSVTDILDRNGQSLRRIPFSGYFDYMTKPPISPDGRYASCMVLNPWGHSALVNCHDGVSLYLTEHTGSDITTLYSSFSPDGNFYCIGGMAKARVIDLNTGQEYVYLETARGEDTNDKTLISCSNSGIVTALTTIREKRDTESSLELRVYANKSEIFSKTINLETITGLITPEVSPNGSYILIRPNSYGVGGYISSSSFIVMNTAGRR